MMLQRYIGESVIYERALVILKAIKKRGNMGELMPLLPPGKKLGELEGLVGREGEGNTSTRHLTLEVVMKVDMMLLFLSSLQFDQRPEPGYPRTCPYICRRGETDQERD